MKTRIALCALTLGVFAAACDNKARNYSALQPLPPPANRPVVQPVPQGQLPGVPAVPTGPVRGGRGGTPTPPRDHDTSGPRSGGGSRPDSGPSISTPTQPRPVGPGPDVSGGDPRDAGRRLEDSTCASFRALTGRWTVKVDEKWDTLNRGSNKSVKKKLETLAAPFFADSLCDGLRTLRGKNARIAKQIVQRIGDKKLEILITDDDEAGEFKKHRFHILWLVGVGKPQIKLGRRVLEGLIASEMPDYAMLLAPSDSQLTREPEINRPDILSRQIQAAKATFFHYVMHMAGAIVDKGKHTDDSFLFHQKELDVIHACTAQVYPYFYIHADGMDYRGKTERGPFYTNSRLACLTCATADVHPSGEIYATMKFFDQVPSQEAQVLCESIKDSDSEWSVTPDRSANLYEEMK